MKRSQTHEEPLSPTKDDGYVVPDVQALKIGMNEWEDTEVH